LDALFTLHGDALLAKMIDSLDCGSSEWTEASNITDRQTLSLLVGGPWFLPLCRTDGSRLEQLLTCICQCVCGTRGDYDAAYIGGAEHKTDILCYLADLLQASLLPLVKRRYCPTAELAAAFSMLPCSSPYTATGSNSSSRSWAGVCSTMSSENVETFRQLAHRKMSTLLEVFVVHSRWSTSRTLQTKRLQILCIMLDVNEEEGEEEGSTWGAIIRASDFISSSTLSPSSTALLDPNIFLSISTELPLRAGVPQLLRVLGIRATEALLNLLVHSFCQTDSAWDRRVKSLAYWAHQEQQQHEKHLVGLGTRPTTDFNVPQRSYVLRSVSVAVQRLLAALDDSSDTVRVHVLSALQMAAPVIGYATATTNVSGASGEENSSGRVVEARNGVSYLDICRRLLTSLVTDAQRSSSSGSSVATSNGDTDIEAVRCSIEATLRIYAMLDPSAMLPFLREAEQQLPPLNEDQKRFRASLPEAHEVLNALNDHCTLLVKFQKEL
jgi:hypothetical protein